MDFSNYKATYDAILVANLAVNHALQTSYKSTGI